MTCSCWQARRYSTRRPAACLQGWGHVGHETQHLLCSGAQIQGRLSRCGKPARRSQVAAGSHASHAPTAHLQRGGRVGHGAQLLPLPRGQVQAVQFEQHEVVGPAMHIHDVTCAGKQRCKVTPPEHLHRLPAAQQQVTGSALHE